ncbi:hypothetical protein [Roseimicrobium sp. ORNL1]|uniref:hypothetical protein n=1 Tax=Roseimicrobium sp. ORNL1 TaxID=2711231 RepID=UPI0013E1BC1C|nr:hypothetical protein [Roseimicrobium sp. ORNL1]QIF05446.1 hypothetical protein G5S37_29410 [Roseimicrobium sp. ORNL1]
MKSSRLLLFVFIGAAWIATAGAKDESSNEWVIRTFRVNLAVLNGPPTLPIAITPSPLDPFAPADSPSSTSPDTSPTLVPQPITTPPQVPALPDTGASDKEWKACLEKSSIALSKIFDVLGAPSPAGMVALYDAPSSTLVVRTTTEHLKLLGPTLENLGSAIPRDLIFTMEVIEAEEATIRNLVDEINDRREHASTWKRCAELLGAGQAKSLGQFRLATHSGQPVTTQSGLETTPVKELQVDSSGRVVAIHGESHSAVAFEVDPVLGPDSLSLEVAFRFHFDYAPALERAEKVAGLVGTSTIEVPVQDHQGASLSAKLTLPVGATKLVGVWRPRGTPEHDRGNVMHAAFLRTEAPLTLASSRHDLSALLQQYAAPPPNNAFGKQTEAEPSTTDPNALISRIIKVHPTFFAVAATGDPTERICSVQKILEAQGIPFPEGSSATFNPIASSITVRNTAKSIALIETFADSACLLPPQQIGCTAYIIEGESALVRQLAEQSRSTSDHSEVWERVKKLSASGALRIVEVIRGESGSGDRASFENGTSRFNIGEVVLHERENPEGTTSNVDKKSPGENTTVHGASTQASALLRADPIIVPVESRVVGTSMEWDPVIAEGGRCVRVNFLLEHHFASPVSRSTTSSQGSIIPAGVPAAKFHCARILSMSTLLPGIPRLMGTWKVEGAPAREGRDISQAFFLRMDVLPFGARE